MRSVKVLALTAVGIAAGMLSAAPTASHAAAVRIPPAVWRTAAVREALSRAPFPREPGSRAARIVVGGMHIHPMYLPARLTTQIERVARAGPGGKFGLQPWDSRVRWLALRLTERYRDGATYKSVGWEFVLTPEGQVVSTHLLGTPPQLYL